MKIVTAQLISGKKVLLRLDLDVVLGKDTGGRLQVTDDFRLKAGLPTLKLCLENAQQVIVMGHIGRPEGKEVPDLSVAPIYQWLIDQNLRSHLESGKLKLLENLRFEEEEDRADENYAKQLAELGDFFVNEAFAAHHRAASTTVLPTLLPHAAGLQFAKEVEVLTKVRENPQKPLVAIIGGVKLEDKLPAVEALSKIADAVLVGGKISKEIKDHQAHNVMAGKLNNEGIDLAPETVESWKNIIKGAKMIVWNGPMGRINNEELTMKNLGSAKGTCDVAQMILQSDAEVIVGGGDTVGFLEKVGLLEQFENKGFISTGGGAMLEFLVRGTLPTIEALVT